MPAALAARPEVGCDPEVASFLLGRENPVPALQPDMPIWQERIYAVLARNAVRAPDYLPIPPLRVVELGTKVELQGKRPSNAAELCGRSIFAMPGTWFCSASPRRWRN